jgi:hypothetical protein
LIKSLGPESHHFRPSADSFFRDKTATTEVSCLGCERSPHKNYGYLTGIKLSHALPGVSLPMSETAETKEDFGLNMRAPFFYSTGGSQMLTGTQYWVKLRFYA